VSYLYKIEQEEQFFKRLRRRTAYIIFGNSEKMRLCETTVLQVRTTTPGVVLKYHTCRHRSTQSHIEKHFVESAVMVCLATVLGLFASDQQFHGSRVASLAASLDGCCFDYKEKEKPVNGFNSEESLDMNLSLGESKEEDGKDDLHEETKEARDDAPGAPALSGILITETNNSSEDSATSNNKLVRFDTLQIHDHVIILGCNPGQPTTKGAPLAIDWEVIETQRLSVDEFEATRGPRRSAKQLRLSQEYREDLLLRIGYTTKQIELGTELAQVVRTMREWSAMDFGVDLSAASIKQFNQQTNNKTSVGPLTTRCNSKKQQHDPDNSNNNNNNKHRGLRKIFVRTTSTSGKTAASVL